MQGKVEICGVNTSRLPVLKNEEAQALLEVETLDGEQFEILYTGEMSASELAEQVREKEAEIMSV